MKVTYITILVSLLFLSSCAVKPTGYVKRNNSGGSQYGCNDKKVGDHEFAIIAKGNRYTDAERVAKLALFHAANVTIENERASFQIIKKDDESLLNHRPITIGLPIPIPNALPVLFIPVGETTSLEATSILIIKLCDKQPTNQSECINAEQVINELKHNFPETHTPAHNQ